jgi:transcriptional regulator with XRE-family HTH domain
MPRERPSRKPAQSLDSFSLDRQLANYVRKFLENTGLTQRQLGKMAGIDPANLNGWIGGYKKLSSDKLGKLHQIIHLNRFELETKFTRNFAGRIVSLQERGRDLAGELRFDGSGWVSGQSGVDPNNSTSVTGTWKEGGEHSGDDIIDVLRQIDAIHAQARQAIADYIAKAQKAKPNKDGVTEGPRKVNTNDKSSHPGSRGDMLATPEKLKEQIAFVRKEREKTEEQLSLEAELQKERELYWDVRVKAARKELKAQ